MTKNKECKTRCSLGKMFHNPDSIQTIANELMNKNRGGICQIGKNSEKIQNIIEKNQIDIFDYCNSYDAFKYINCLCRNPPAFPKNVFLLLYRSCQFANTVFSKAC